MEQHEGFIRRCIELSYQAREKRNGPFGALLALNGRIVLEAENTVVTGKNPLGHSELNLLTEAVRRFSREELQKATLYASAEPCVMCSGALFNSGIRHVVYAISGEALRPYFPEDPYISCRDILATASGVRIQIEGPMFEKEALKAHEGFWS
jgi:tRNA(Arg) A34 adenosine deaminase TadA